jgi:hypothetical protein
MTNKLYVGFTRTIDPPAGGCLFIDDEVREGFSSSLTLAFTDVMCMCP